MGCCHSKSKRKSRHHTQTHTSVSPRVELSSSSTGSDDYKSTAESDGEIGYWIRGLPPQLPSATRSPPQATAGPPKPPPSIPPPPPPVLIRSHTVDVIPYRDVWDVETPAISPSLRVSRSNTMRSNLSGRVRAATTPLRRGPSVLKSEVADAVSDGHPPQYYGETGFGHSAVAWSGDNAPQHFTMSQISTLSGGGRRFYGPSSTLSFASHASQTSMASKTSRKSGASSSVRIASSKRSAQHHYYSYNSAQRKPSEGQQRERSHSEASRSNVAARQKRRVAASTTAATAPATPTGSKPPMSFSEKSEFANAMRHTSAWAAQCGYGGGGSGAASYSTQHEPLDEFDMGIGQALTRREKGDDDRSAISIGTRAVAGAGAGNSNGKHFALQRKARSTVLGGGAGLQRNFSIPRRMDTVCGESRVGNNDTFVA